LLDNVNTKVHLIYSLKIEKKSPSSIEIARLNISSTIYTNKLNMTGIENIDRFLDKKMISTKSEW